MATITANRESRAFIKRLPSRTGPTGAPMRNREGIRADARPNRPRMRTRRTCAPMTPSPAVYLLRPQKSRTPCATIETVALGSPACLHHRIRDRSPSRETGRCVPAATAHTRRHRQTVILIARTGTPHNDPPPRIVTQVNGCGIPRSLPYPTKTLATAAGPATHRGPLRRLLPADAARSDRRPVDALALPGTMYPGRRMHFVQGTGCSRGSTRHNVQDTGD